MLLEYEMGDSREQRSFHYTAAKRSECLPFCLLSGGDYTCDSRYYTQREGSRQFLFLGGISGNGELRYGGKVQNLTKGKAAVIDCSRYQYYASKGPGRWRFAWFHFRGAAADGFVQMLNGSSLRLFDWNPERPIYAELTDLVANPDRSTDLRISLWLHEFLNGLALGLAEPFDEPYAELMAEASVFIRQNCGETLTVEQLAKRFSLSKYHFIRVFKQYIGQTPHEYLTLARIDEAKRLLATTGLGIGEIAALAGFLDSKALIRCFHMHTGTTPARFRRQIPHSVDGAKQ